MLNAVYKVGGLCLRKPEKMMVGRLDFLLKWFRFRGHLSIFVWGGGAVRNSDEIYQLGGRFSDLRRVGGLGDGLWAFLRTLAWICLPSWGTTSMIKQAWEMDLPFQNKNLRFTESRWTGQDHLWSAVTRGEASLPLGSQDLNLHRRLQNWWWNR